MTPCFALPSDNRTEAKARDDIRAKLDMSRPSYRGAVALARDAAWESMRADRRDTISKKDRAAGDAILCHLLWLVPGHDGGFDGLDDAALTTRCARYRLSVAHVLDASFAPGSWPGAVASLDAARATEQRQLEAVGGGRGLL